MQINGSNQGMDGRVPSMKGNNMGKINITKDQKAVAIQKITDICS